MTFTATLSYTGSMSALGLSVGGVPNAWSYGSAGGSNVPSVAPSSGDGSNFDFSYLSIPASPVSFTFTVSYPAGLTGNQTFSGISAIFRPTGGSLQSVSLSNIVLAPRLPAITSALGASAVVNTPFTYTITASESPTSYSATSLPTGLLLNRTTGVISGTPTISGSYSITLSAANANGTGTTSTLQLTVGSLSEITSSLTASGTAGTAFSYTITASNSPSTYNVGPLPTGLQADIGSGVISGRPTNAGTTNVTISANNAVGTGPDATLVITIAPGNTGNGAPVFSTQPSSATVAEGGAVTFTAAATGASSYQWRRNGAPISGATATTFSISSVSTVNAGDYTVVATNSNGSTTSNVATLTVTPQPIPPAFTTQPASQIVNEGSDVVFDPVVTGATSYQWKKDGSAVSGGTAMSLTFPQVTTASAGNYTLVASNSAGATTSNVARLTVNPVVVFPGITSQPVSQVAGVGSNVTLSVSASGTSLGYQWQRNGMAISGATTSSIVLTNVYSGSAGDYNVVVTNAAGSVTSNIATITIRSVEYFGTLGTNGGTFALFIRTDRTGAFLGYARASKVAFVTKEIVLDATGHFSFAATGSASTAALTGSHAIRAAAVQYVVDGSIMADGTLAGSISGLGLSLSAPAPAISGATSGVAGFYESGAVGSSATSYSIIGASGDVYVATVTTTGVDAGKGTVDSAGAMKVTTENNATVSGTIDSNAKISLSATISGGTTPVVFAGGNAEVTATEKFINISTRAFAGSGDNTLIAGFTVRGSSPKRVLIRGIGPSLLRYDVPTALLRPQLRLYSGQTMIAQNVGWSTSTDAAAIVTASAQVGAFPLDAGSNDSVLLLYVAPGGYTAQVSSTDSSTGVAMIEVYEVP